MKRLRILTLLAAAFLRPRTVIACNAGEGTSPTGRKTMMSDDIVPQRYLIAATGGGAGRAALCDATKKPLGLYFDQVDSPGEAVAVELFGAIQGTRLAVVGTALIAAGDPLASDASGKATKAAVAAWCFGTALHDAAAGELVEFVPAHPHKI